MIGLIRSRELALSQVRLTGGRTTGNGGAILSEESIELTDIELTGNSADSDGGALFIGGSGFVGISNSTIERNNANERGGAQTLRFIQPRIVGQDLSWNFLRNFTLPRQVLAYDFCQDRSWPTISRYCQPGASHSIISMNRLCGVGAGKLQPLMYFGYDV